MLGNFGLSVLDNPKALAVMKKMVPESQSLGRVVKFLS